MPFLALTWRWAFSPLHIAGGAAILALLAVVAYARQMRYRPGAALALLVMRLAVVAALTVLLLGPSVQPPAETLPGKPALHIFVDTSGSMLTEDVAGQSRIEHAAKQWLSDEQLNRLRAAYNVQLFGFDASVKPLPIDALRDDPRAVATGRASRIAESLRTGVLRVPTWDDGAAILVLSDGHAFAPNPSPTDATLAEVAAMAKARKLPIHAAALGGRTLSQDLALTAAMKQRTLMVNEPGRLAVTVRQVGFENAATTLHLRQGDTHITRPINFAGQQSVDVTLPVEHQQPGTYEYRVSIDEVAGEAEPGNNVQTVFAEVTDERIKVLLLEGQPYWDTKYLAQSLRKDARIALTQITQVSLGKRTKIVTRGAPGGAPGGDGGDTGGGAAVAQLPTTADMLSRYSVVILGRGLEHLYRNEPQAAALLSDFVREQNGHVIFARGRPYDPNDDVGQTIGEALAPIEPVAWGQGLITNRSLRLTPEGKLAPAFAFDELGIDPEEAVSVLKAFRVMPTIERAGVSAITWAHALPYNATGSATDANATDAPPAIVYMNLGGGSVVAILGEGMWQWANLPPDLKKYDGLYDAFWSNLVRSLAMGSDFQPHEQVALRLSETNVRLDETVTLTVSTRRRRDDFQPKLRVIDPSGQVHEPTLRAVLGAQKLQATFTPAATGVYQVELDAAPLKPAQIDKRFSVYSEDVERLEVAAMPDELRRLAAQTGGLFLDATAADELPAQLARHRAARAAPGRPEYVWDRAWVLVILLVWMGGEWLIRRVFGLL